MPVRLALLTLVFVMLACTSSIADTNRTDTSDSSATYDSSVHSRGGNATFTQVADGVFVRYGQHKTVSADSIAEIANHGFIIGESGVAIIDPGGSVDMSTRTLAEVREITSLPVTHVIVSHVHPDHSLGLAAYAGKSLEQHHPEIIGHSRLAVELSHNMDFFRQNYASDETADKLLKLIEADQVHGVEGELILDLGNRKLVVSSYGNAHSGSDISVYDSSTKTLWAGDLLFVERLPSIDGSILGWLEALDHLASFDITTVIPGHGRSGDYSTLVQPQLEYFNLVVKQAREAIAKGVSLNEFIANGERFPVNALRGEWALFDIQHAVNLSRAFAELEWE